MDKRRAGQPSGENKRDVFSSPGKSQNLNLQLLEKSKANVNSAFFGLHVSKSWVTINQPTFSAMQQGVIMQGACRKIQVWEAYPTTEFSGVTGDLGVIPKA